MIIPPSLTKYLPWVGRERPVGHVDTIQDRQLHGWVWQPSAPEKRILVDIFVDGAFYGQQLAHRFRSDLRAHGIGDGRYGFEINLGESSSSARQIDVFALSDQQRSRLASTWSTVSPKVDPIVRTAQAYIRATFRSMHGWSTENGSWPTTQSHEPLYERLFAASPAPSDPAILGKRLCAYLDLVRIRSNLRGFDPSLTLGQYREFLRAYLDSYGKARGRHRAPLSATDIAFLNAPGAQPDHGSRAQMLWATDYDLPSRERVFLWAAYLASALSVEDCLIPPGDIVVLSQIDHSGPFPLTRFMIELIDRNPFLRELPLRTAANRAFITFVFLLLAARHPHFLMFADVDAITALLSGEQGETLFDIHWRETFGEYAAPAPERRWRRMVANGGFDVSRLRFRSVAPSGSRLDAPQIEIRNNICVDVQIFGPFSRALGIGQSARRLAEALRSLNYRIRLCDFTLDHPNQQILWQADAREAPGPARLNIFHMNLEDIPALVAYSADLFSDSINIGVPYLELTPLAPSQYLGLNLVDEIWVASRFIADAVNPHRQAVVIGASVESLVKHGRQTARQAIYGDLVKTGDFVFLTASDALSAVDRKNPLGAIRSFLQAFPTEPGVRLVVKTHSTANIVSSYEQGVWDVIREICAADQRIVLLDRLLPDDAHYALIEGADCLVSLHRSEGLGYHILEAMQLGVPVIATSYSGPADFCSPETSFPCDYRLVHVEPHQYARANAEQVWAEPDYSHAARQMLTVFYDRVASERVVTNARRLVDKDYSPAALSIRLALHLRALFDRHT